MSIFVEICYNITIKGEEENYVKAKKNLTILFAMIIAINCINFINVNAASSAKKVGNAWYTITSEDSDTAEYKKPANKNVQTVVIPNTVKIGQKTYKVGSIGKNFKTYKI